jgi:taurine dioxygenase
MTSTIGIQLTPVATHIGAVVENVDLSQPVGDELAQQLQTALYENGVLFFRNQDLTPARQIEVGELFGPILPPMVEWAEPPAPGMIVLDAVEGNTRVERWHTDQPYDATPPKAALLYCRKTPPIGGDTCFSSTTQAYDELSPQLKQMLDGLTGVHSPAGISGLKLGDSPRGTGSPTMNFEAKETLHPLIRVVPETGKKAIFASRPYIQRIAELSDGESDMVLQFLLAHVQEPRFQCRFSWDVGSLAIWDERSTQHCAIPDYKGRRIMHRCMVAGEVPVAVGA